MRLILLSLCIPAFQPTATQVGPDDFLRIVKGAIADIKDVSYTYEGRLELLDPQGETDSEREHNRIARQQVYQGLYSWRSDGSMRIDYYHALGVNDNVTQTSVAIFGGKTISIGRSPDSRASSVINTNGQNPWIILNHSSHAINWIWYYQWLTDPKSMNFVDLGWEVVEGHRCLKVQLDAAVMPPGKKNPNYRLWIDLERGAHPLLVEERTIPPDVASRMHSIKLTSVSLPGGKRVWLPIAGTRETFLVDHQVYGTKPVWRETCNILEGTIQVNKGVPDSSFSLMLKDPPKPKDGVLKRQFDDLLAKAPPPERTDPKSVEDRLANQLAEADRQSKMIEASSPAREFWSTTLFIQLGLFTGGAVLISWFIVVMRKSR